MKIDFVKRRKTYMILFNFFKLFQNKFERKNSNVGINLDKYFIQINLNIYLIQINLMTYFIQINLNTYFNNRLKIICRYYITHI